MKKWGVRPEQIRDLLALSGDTTDCVPGVDGIGEETARKLLLQHDDLDAIRKICARLLLKKNGKPSAKTEALVKAATEKILVKGEESTTLDLMIRLVSLVRDIPLISSTADLAWSLDEGVRDAFYRELEFFRLLGTGGSRLTAAAPIPSGPVYNAQGTLVG